MATMSETILAVLILGVLVLVMRGIQAELNHRGLVRRLERLIELLGDDRD